jgi:hypothetical protein
VYLSLAIWLEEWCTKGTGLRSQWLFVDGSTTRESLVKDQNKEANAGKLKYTTAVKKAINSNQFQPTAQGALGSHSIRKLGATHCRRCGASKDDVDYRARWASKRMQDRYTDVQLPWPDLNAASKLCQGGPIKYKVKQEAGITDEWIYQNVTPGIANVFNEQVAAILGRALLWACFDTEWSEKVGADIRHKVVTSFIQLDRFNADDVNPVDKVEVLPFEGVFYDTRDPQEIIATEYYALTRAYLVVVLNNGMTDRLEQLKAL